MYFSIARHCMFQIIFTTLRWAVIGRMAGAVRWNGRLRTLLVKYSFTKRFVTFILVYCSLLLPDKAKLRRHPPSMWRRYLSSEWIRVSVTWVNKERDQLHWTFRSQFDRQPSLLSFPLLTGSSKCLPIGAYTWQRRYNNPAEVNNWSDHTGANNWYI